MPRIDLIQFRRDTEAVMLATPNVLALGEPFFIIDTNEIIVGDGASVGSALSRFTVGGPSGSVATDAIWDAADDLAIGTGANTAARVAFAANTFPAKGSAGALVAKAISDAALTVLAAATLAAMIDAIGGAASVGTGGLVRASAGVPVAGTNGQVLAKASNSDHDVGWVDQTGGGSGLTQAQVLSRAALL